LIYLTFILFGKKEDTKYLAFYNEIDSTTKYPKIYYNYINNDLLIKVEKLKE
jgi:hypothetical protein